jgi:EmrB/QacA subfamily drug resistance transporter
MEGVARSPRPVMPPRILLPLIVACALFMENLDSTVLSTALPAIAADFGESPIHLKLALTSYLLALAVFIPASGWLADRFGARIVFGIAITVFVAGSIWCGLSHSIGEIVAARVVQGIGGSMMVPVGRLVILRSVPKSELVGSLAWLTVPALVGPVVGPPLGGFITTYFDWRWIFWINVPIGILGLILATLYIPDIRGETRTKFDALGFVLVSLGLAAFVTGSTTLGLNVLPLAIVFGLLAVGAVLLIAYYLHTRRRINPILDLTLFRLPTFRASTLGASLFRFGVGATPFLLPLMLQLAFGMTPFESGMITFAAAIGAIAMKFVAPIALRTFGFRTVIIVNGLIASVFIAMPAAFQITTPVLLMTLLLLVGGLFRSLQFTSINALAFADVPGARMSQATSMTSVLQQISVSVGISIAAISLEISTGGDIAAIASHHFILPFLVVGGLAALSVLSFFSLPWDAGQEMSGHQKQLAPDPVTAARER